MLTHALVDAKFAQSETFLFVIFLNIWTIFDPRHLPDSPRLSRLDRGVRSVSQPRGKRDSSVSSAYAGGLCNK